MSVEEVVIVGGGVAGCSTAYELASRGVGVTLIEKERPAWGASGRNPGYAWLHTRAAGVQLKLGLAGRSYYDVLKHELDDFGFRESGGMIYFFDHQREIFPAFVANRVNDGLPMVILDAAQARERCPILPEDVAGATWNPLDAHVDPGRLTQALADAAAAAGATIVSDSEVSEIEVNGGRCSGVRTTSGSYTADIVVVAAGVWSPQLLAPLDLHVPIEAMRLGMVLTEPVPTRFDPVLYGPTGVKQYALTKDVDGYIEDDFLHPLETIFSGVELLELAAQRPDGRVLLGCPMDFPGLDDRPTVAGTALTLGVLGDHLPALQNAVVERIWAGLLPQTPDALPILGPVSAIDGLNLATGHVFGMLAGPISGRLVAQSITGEATDCDLEPYRYERDAIGGASAQTPAELRQW